MEWNPYIQLNIKFVSLAQSKKQFAETEIEGNINKNSIREKKNRNESII